MKKQMPGELYTELHDLVHRMQKAREPGNDIFPIVIRMSCNIIVTILYEWDEVTNGPHPQPTGAGPLTPDN